MNTDMSINNMTGIEEQVEEVEIEEEVEEVDEPIDPEIMKAVLRASEREIEYNFAPKGSGKGKGKGNKPETTTTKDKKKKNILTLNEFTNQIANVEKSKKFTSKRAEDKKKLLGTYEDASVPKRQFNARKEPYNFVYKTNNKNQYVDMNSNEEFPSTIPITKPIVISNWRKVIS
jgi:hypothetical protein